ncbi:MAG: NADH-quinone oxidoreductase subunit NuoN [Rhodospirillales bacterium]|nr:NADH-quinone oxidoreductase subunit NuoN [Rhodospirillales bacterium]
MNAASQVPNLFPALPEIFVVIAAMALLMVGVFFKQNGASESVVLSRTVSRLSLAVFGLGIVIVAALAPAETTQTFSGMFIVDEYGVFFKILILIASGVSLYISQDYMEFQGIARFEYAILFLFATVGMMMMVSANDLLSLYVGLEMQSLSLYVVATFQRDDIHSTEAGLKYFVLGAIASGMLLYGSSMIYGFAGTTNFDALAQTFEHFGHAAPPVGLIVGLVFVLAALAFKVSAVPFHMWTPDVYEGAPTPVTAFFSVAPKIAALALFVRVMMDPFAGLSGQWQQIVVLISILSMVLGAFAAIGQTNIKRLMAYSSISHVGYALIGLAAGSEAGVRSVLIYLGIYLFMNLGVFTCILSMRRGDSMVVEISDLSGLSKSHPTMALAMAIFMFSMAGIPPLAGFFGKIYVFLAAVEAELYTLAVIGVLSSVVAAFYYIRIIKIMYFDDSTETLDRHIGRNVGLVMLVTSVVVLFFFLYPDPLLSSAAEAAASLVGSAPVH